MSSSHPFPVSRHGLVIKDVLRPMSAACACVDVFTVVRNAYQERLDMRAAETSDALFYRLSLI